MKLKPEEIELVKDLVRYAETMDYFDQGCLDQDDEDDALRIAALDAQRPIFDGLKRRLVIE
jgi:hypothetical protein